jgi:hypothetical protein
MSSTVDQRAFAVLLTGYDAGKEAIMPIRMRSRDKPLDHAQPSENKEMGAPLGGAPKCDMGDRKTKLRMLCGSF